MQDIYDSALKREQRRRDSRLHTGVDSLFDFDELRPDSEVTANGHKHSPLFDKKRYEPKGFIAELTAAESRREPRISVPLFDTEVSLARGSIPPIVLCQCNGRRAYALLDTSNVYSTISRGLVSAFNMSRDVIQDRTTPPSPISGLERPIIHGKLKYMEVSLGKSQLNMQLFVVSDTTPELVLGVDFLKKTQTVINFSESCALVGGEKVRFVSGQELGGLTKGRPL
ncbi:uncharacterized protein LOC119108671 isoform X1 [Pollicipes pollicipes]|uniref:uncharacterized protein LOC119108404 n=1 Tax=Pollicipes pollicipes TaxID=41117 RepID=UPI0018854C29|nr:uncharacterized protein LOC119108404 [Pollicipes pollicipes]XP_037088054.1 uncharacterized protein LOC119108566 [Pollicipes pollicipes]XP_037088191.1 uncharacterized protein LOC119108671 isoform X1 [Pollicipes pollicipes]